MIEDIFKQTHVGPFLFFTLKAGNILQLRAGMPDEQEPFTLKKNVWPKINVDTRTLTYPDQLISAAISTRNLIASTSRRAPGNHLIFHPELHAKWVAARSGFDMDTHIDGVTIHLDEEQPTDEIRSIFHKPQAHMFKAVDGPYQLVNGKTFRNPNYLSYFYRMKVTYE